MSDFESRLAALETKVASLLSSAAPMPEKDFPIRVGKFKGRKPSELTVKELEGQAWFKEKLVKEDAAKPEGERKDPKYVEYDRRDAECFRAWSAFKKAGGLAPQADYTTKPSADFSSHGDAFEGDAEGEVFNAQFDDQF
jgi:hypothetical protein